MNYIWNNIINEILIKINVTALFRAVEKGNVDIIKLLLTNDKLDPNIININKLIICKIKFQIKYFNEILNQIF